MKNNLKQEIEKDFDKRRNYHSIMSKVEEKGKNKILKHILLPAVGFVFVMVVFLGLDNIPSQKNIIEKTSQENVVVNLKINKISKGQGISSSIDAKRIDGKIQEIEQMDFVKELKVPKDIELRQSYGIYVRSNRQVSNYDILHDYVLYYSDNKEQNSRNISINFSKIGKPLRDYLLSEKDEKSLVGQTEVIIQQYQDMYLAQFKYDNKNFDIETNGISQEELVSLLTSIIK